MNTPLHEIFDEKRIGYQTKLRINKLLEQAKKEKIIPAAEDTVRTLFLAIDMQNDFMENGELPVPGSHRDIWNAAQFLYNNMNKITQIAVSLDTHQPQQIFHPNWWLDEQGNNPLPFTIIAKEDVQSGKWRPVNNPDESLDYVVNLSEKSKKDLCIWPYHCLEGTFGATLESQFANMVYFHSIARKSVPTRIIKGKDPLSEMYGIIKTEYDQDNYCNIDFLNELKTYDKIIIVGEAKSHCVLESLRQILGYYESSAEVTSRIFVLEDCMSSIPGFEKNTEETFEYFKERYKITVTRSSALTL